jgi:hypothetical protein
MPSIAALPQTQIILSDHGSEASMSFLRSYDKVTVIKDRFAGTY